jgi:hypothetical protein
MVRGLEKPIHAVDVDVDVGDMDDARWLSDTEESSFKSLNSSHGIS